MSFVQRLPLIAPVPSLARLALTTCLLLPACSRPTLGTAGQDGEAAELPALSSPVPAAAPSTAGDADEKLAAPPIPEPEPPPPDFVPAPLATAPRSVLALQTAAVTRTAVVPAADGHRVRVSLIDLAPRLGAWHLLRIEDGTHAALGLPRAEFHLQPRDRGTRLELSQEGVVLDADGRRTACALWGADSSPLAAAAEDESAYSRLCNGALYVRNTVSGHRTSKEWVTDFLRDRVPAGDQVVNFVKEELMQDAFLRTAEVERDAEAAAEHDRPPGAPAPPRLAPEAQASLFVPTDLGLKVKSDDAEGRLLVGRWYGIEEEPGIYVGGLSPSHVSRDVVREQGAAVSPLDEVEAKALTYLVAFDLDRFDLDFALGTDHPRVDWSERAQPGVRDDRLPGPDGFDTVAPLARTGRVAPHRAAGVIATFIGGFKRSHGAFKTGRLAQIHRGSHYGFVEEGVILSSLQPGLATVLVWRDGTVELATWSEEDDHRLGEVRHARQNGVPILEPDPDTGAGRPGALVTKWGEGNWSGSQERKFRTLRAGLCLQDGAAGRFLVYGYFSSVTTSAMARVFQAYGCGYAMLLDMNALEHTYLAVYQKANGEREVHHLDRGMSVLDLTYQGAVVPRFLAYPDNRDFFYISRRKR